MGQWGCGHSSVGRGAMGQQGWGAQWGWGCWGGGDWGAQHSRSGGCGVVGWGAQLNGAEGNGAVGLWGSAVGITREGAVITLPAPPQRSSPHSALRFSAPPRPPPFIPAPFIPAPPRFSPAPFSPAPPIHPPPISSPRPLIGSFSHQSVRSGSSGPASFGLGALSRKHVIERRMRVARTGSTCSGGACAVQVPEWAGGAPRPTGPSPHTP